MCILAKWKRSFKTKSKHPFCFGLNVNDNAKLFHTEQSTFILRNFIQEEVKQGKVTGKLSTLLDFEEIKREDIAHVILKVLHNNDVENERCL